MEQAWQKSQWFQKKLESLPEPVQNANISTKARILILVAGVMIGGILAIAKMVPLGILIIAMSLVMTLIFTLKSKQARKIEKMEMGKECFNHLNLTDEEIQLFDAEMDAPRFTMESDNRKRHIIITEHFLFTENGLNLSSYDCVMCRLSSIASTKHEYMKSIESKMPLEKVHYFTFFDASGAKLMGVNMETNKRMKLFADACAQYAPMITVK